MANNNYLKSYLVFMFHIWGAIKQIVFLTDTRKLEIEPIPYGVTIKIITTPNPTPGIITGNNTTAMPISSTSGPRITPVLDQYMVTFTDESGYEKVENFTGSSFNLESMKPCTKYNFAVTTTMNGTFCLLKATSASTIKLRKLSYSTITVFYSVP